MTDHLITAVVSVLLALIGVAAISVLLSRNSLTSNVLVAGGGAFSKALCVALSPVGGSVISKIAGCGGLIEDVNSVFIPQ